MAQLASGCRFIFNATNLSTGVRFTLEPDRVGDYVIGYAKTSSRRETLPALRLADAVAASAAFPVAFTPLILDGYEFPCAGESIPHLLDGGAYDNLGLEAVNRLGGNPLLIALNAGGLFHTGFGRRIPVVSDLARVRASLYRQSTSLRSSVIVDRFQAYEHAVKRGERPPDFGRRGVFFSLATTPKTMDPQWATRARKDENEG